MKTPNPDGPAVPPAAGAVPAATARPAHGDARRITLFVLVLSIVFLGANALVCLTWGKFFQVGDWARWQVFPALLALAFVGSTTLSFWMSGGWLRVLYTASAVWLGFLNFFLFASVACWMVRGVASLAGWPLDLPMLAALVFGLAGLLALYGLINAAWPRISRITVELAHLPDAWEGRSVALVTDLHLGLLRGPGFLRRVIARLKKLQPDAVLISGDMFDGSTLNLDRLIAGWQEFSAPQGIYFVTGNHDEFMDRELVLKAVEQTGIRVLRNERVVAEGLQILGVHDSEMTHPARLDTLLRTVGLDSRQPSILLAHRPENLPIVRESGTMLQVSGHTHGGQFWP